MRRSAPWTPRDWGFLAALILMAVATIVGLTLQSNNIRDQKSNLAAHNRFDRRQDELQRQSCVYTKANRILLAQVLTDLSRGSFLDEASQQRLREEANLVESRVNELVCK